jgi:hypothetical protein
MYTMPRLPINSKPPSSSIAFNLGCSRSTCCSFAETFWCDSRSSHQPTTSPTTTVNHSTSRIVKREHGIHGSLVGSLRRFRSSGVQRQGPRLVSFAQSSSDTETTTPKAAVSCRSKDQQQYLSHAHASIGGPTASRISSVRRRKRMLLLRVNKANDFLSS